MAQVSRDILRAVLAAARLNPDELMPGADDMLRRYDDSDSRAGFKTLKEFLPQAAWEWPEFADYAALWEVEETRNEMVHAVNNTLARNLRFAYRLEQMRAITDRRPTWLVRAANDSRDSPECRRLDGFEARHDDPFWETVFFPHLLKPGCRCYIRTYSLDCD